jgi:4-carboxymuconolactone decarboxylase
VQQATEVASTLNLIAVGEGVSIVPISMQHMHPHGVAYRPILGDGPRAPLSLAYRSNEGSAAVRNLTALARRAVVNVGQDTLATSGWSRARKSKEKEMAASSPSSARELVRPVAPKLVELAEKVVYGDVWERPGLSKRDRSLITVATLVAHGRERQLVGHLQRALSNGVSKDEIGELITHLAFYAGWPAAMTAALVAKDVFETS